MGYMKDFDRRIRQGGDDAVRAALEYALTVAARWIPVEERLPEEGEVVLLYYGGDTDPIAVGKYLGLGGVTHWMPLPEPPEVK